MSTRIVEIDSGPGEELPSDQITVIFDDGTRAIYTRTTNCRCPYCGVFLTVVEAENKP